MTIEITQTRFLDRSDPTGIKEALTMNGSYLRVINVIITNGVQGIQVSPLAVDHLVYGCLIYHNGLTAGYGHGIYNQNTGPTRKQYLCNAIFDNFWGNFAPHGSPGPVSYIDCGKSTLFDSGSPVNEARHNLFWDSSDTINEPHFFENVVYQGLSNAISCRLGDPDNPTLGVELYNNYFVNAPSIVLYGSEIGIDRLDGNEFYGAVEGWSTESYPDNVYAPTAPTSGIKIFLRKNIYADRALLTVFNYDEADSVSVNVLSDTNGEALWSAGDVIVARNVQDYWVDTQELTVAQDGTIAVDMQAANRSVARPVGTADYTPVTTFPKFGCFVLDRMT